MSQPPHQPDADQPDPHHGPPPLPPQGQPSYPPVSSPPDAPPPYAPPAGGPAPYPPAGPAPYPPAGPAPYPPAGPSPYAPPAGPPPYGSPAGAPPPYPPAGPSPYAPPAGPSSYPPPAGPSPYPPPAGASYPGAPQQPAPGWQPPYAPAGGIGHPGGYAQGTFAPGGYPAAPPKKSPVLKIVLISVAAVLVLCLGGTVAIVMLTKDKVADVVQAAKTTVVEPTTLGGRPKVTEPALVSVVDALSDQMHQVPGATSSVGAMYGNPAQQDLVMVAAASSLTGDPQSKYDEFVSSLQTGGFRGVDMVDTDPGPLGGIARCGDGAPGGTDMALCIWSDNGSVGMIAMLLKPVSELETEFVALRGQIEQRS